MTNYPWSSLIRISLFRSLLWNTFFSWVILLRKKWYPQVLGLTAKSVFHIDGLIRPQISLRVKVCPLLVGLVHELHHFEKTRWRESYIDRSQPLFYFIPQDSHNQAGSTRLSRQSKAPLCLCLVSLWSYCLSLLFHQNLSDVCKIGNLKEDFLRIKWKVWIQTCPQLQNR